LSSISDEIRARVRQAFGDRCSYCQSAQRYFLGIMEIDHIIPKVDGGSDAETNLCLSCRLCNSYKGTQTRKTDPGTGQVIALFNPREQNWADHFHWSEDGIYVVGKTACGQITIDALQLNNPYALTVRKA
jgi:5-methylcytosine-specific restriction endonuclease McrA